MKNSLKYAVLACLLLAACETATVENYEAALDTWIGKDERDLVTAWGVPDKQYDAGGGTRLLAYVKGRLITYPGMPPSCQTRFVANVGYTDCFNGTPAMVQSLRCETTFTLSHRKITAWRHEGNDCRL